MLDNSKRVKFPSFGVSILAFSSSRLLSNSLELLNINLKWIWKRSLHVSMNTIKNSFENVLTFLKGGIKRALVLLLNANNYPNMKLYMIVVVLMLVSLATSQSILNAVKKPTAKNHQKQSKLPPTKQKPYHSPYATMFDYDRYCDPYSPHCDYYSHSSYECDPRYDHSCHISYYWSHIILIHKSLIIQERKYISKK